MMTNDKTTHKMNKHFVLLLTLMALGFLTQEVQAQMQSQITPPIGALPDNKMLGGTSVGTGLNGISSPNLFNGSTNITVPIFSFGNGNAGVSLSYNTMGVKVDEFASSVGLHWNLNCGGSIVRVVRGLPDEFLANSDSLLEANSIYQHDHSIYIPNKEMHIYGRWFTDVEPPAKINAPNAYTDNEYDEFVVSVSGLSFKFYVGKNLKIFTSMPGNVKVQLLADNVPITDISQLGATGEHALGFKITVPGGDAYYFRPSHSESFDGKNYFWDWSHLITDAINLSIYFPGSYPTNWRLEKIVGANGQVIHYKYATTYMDAGIIGLSNASYLNYYVMESEYNGVANQNFLGVTRNDAKPEGFPLQEIDYPNNVQVHFDYDMQHWNAKGDYFINEIRVASGQNCKRFRFYINQDTINNRYFLDSIVQVSCDGSKTEPYYRFTYNPFIEIKKIVFLGHEHCDTIYAVLPRRLNSGQDLYGYYNNDSTGLAVTAPQSTGDGISVPRHHPDIGGSANYGNERDYDARYAQAGLLTSVQNAYGSIDSFFYGANVIHTVPLADSIPTDNSFMGISQPDGVRVDSIVSTDSAHPGQRLLTVFDYGGGQVFMPGGYFHYPDYVDSATGAWKDVIYQSMFLTSHQLVNGANHGYSTVDIKNYVNNDLLSRRVITYTNMKDATSDNKPRYYKVPGSKDYFQYPYTYKQYLKDWEIGLPLTVTDYDQNNRIVKKSINQYAFSTVDLSASSYFSSTCTYKVNSGHTTSPDGFNDFYYPYKKAFTDNYYPFKGKATLSSVVTQKYLSDTRFITDTVWYVYDSHNNLKRTVTQNSKGDKTATELVYNYDVDGPQFVFPGQPGYTAHPGTTLYNMSDSGLEIPVSTERWKLLPATTVTDPYGGTVLQNNNRLLSSFITGYQYQDGKLWTKSLWNTQNGSPLSYTEYTGLIAGMSANPYGKVLGAYINSGPVIYFKNTSAATLFDAKGNPLETQLQAQNQYKAMIWDTASGQKLAEAANCRYNDIAYTSFENILPEGNLTSNKPDIISSSGALTGSHVGLLWSQTIPGSAVSYTGTQNLTAGKQYILSFWVNGGMPAVYVGGQLLPISSANLTYTKGSWHSYQVRFMPSAAGKLKITGTAASSQIDEIRLFPAGAQMQSWTYEPLFGKCSQTDPSGRITYYQYDKMGRPNLVLDMDGNILSKTDYHVAQ